MQSSKASDFKIDIAADLHKWRAFIAIGELGSLDPRGAVPRQQPVAAEPPAERAGARVRRPPVQPHRPRRRAVGDRRAPVPAGQGPAGRRRAAGERDPRRGARAERTRDARVAAVDRHAAGRPAVQPHARSSFPAVSLKVLEGSSGQVEEWLADARVDIAILYRYGPTLPEKEQSLAVVDSYLIGPPGDRLTAAAEVAVRRPARAALHPAERAERPAHGARCHRAPAAHHARAGDRGRLAAAAEGRSSRPSGSTPCCRIHAVWSEVKDRRLQAARIVDPPVQRTISMAMSQVQGPAAGGVGRRVADRRRSSRRWRAHGMWRAGRRVTASA